VRSDNVAALTSAGRQAMVDYGITTVIDLRTEAEVNGAPGPPFSTFQSTSPVPTTNEGDGASLIRLHLPLIDDATAPVLNASPAMQDRYLLMVDRRQAAIGAIFEAIASAEGPVLFQHRQALSLCRMSRKDRFNADFVQLFSNFRFRDP